jgi:hypothetical protein
VEVAVEKTHFGDAEKGILCRGGLTTGKSMALDWESVTCKACRDKQLPANVMRADDVAAWLAEKIPGNIKMRERHAEHQIEWAERQERWKVTETMALHAIQHDIMETSPEDWVTIYPVDDKDHRYGVTQELKVQARSSLVQIKVTVSSPYRVEDEVTCNVVWVDKTVTEVWQDHEGNAQETQCPLIDEHVPYEQVPSLWKLGPLGALERYHAARPDDEDDDN